MRDIIKRILLEETLGESRLKWTDELLRQEALKYTTKKDFLKNSESAYKTAKRRGIFDEITQHMDRVKIWTYESYFWPWINLTKVDYLSDLCPIVNPDGKSGPQGTGSVT